MSVDAASGHPDSSGISGAGNFRLRFVSPAAQVNEDDGHHPDEEFETDDDLDESMAERLVGLTEMFPESVQHTSSLVLKGALRGVKCLYKFTRNSAWIFFSTAAVLFAPIVFEMERAQVKEYEQQQQRQILLGPNAARNGVAGGPARR